MFMIYDGIEPIVTKFTFRTNGTCQTPRLPRIGWSYYGADPEWGAKQAIRLRLELEAALIEYDVKVSKVIPIIPPTHIDR
jgi:hypothetical protein